MLTKENKLILDTLIKNEFTYPSVRFESLEATLIPLLPKKVKFARSPDNLSACIKYLIKLGYVEGTEFWHGAYPVSDYKMLHVTYKGQNYKEFTRLQFKQDIFRSVALPVIVALIVSLLTAVSGYLWGMSSLFSKKCSA